MRSVLCAPLHFRALRYLLHLTTHWQKCQRRLHSIRRQINERSLQYLQKLQKFHDLQMPLSFTANTITRRLKKHTLTFKITISVSCEVTEFSSDCANQRQPSCWGSSGKQNRKRSGHITRHWQMSKRRNTPKNTQTTNIRLAGHASGNVEHHHANTPNTRKPPPQQVSPQQAQKQSHTPVRE